MGCIRDPGNSIMESYFWVLKHKLCPLKTPPCSGRGRARGGHFGGIGGTKDCQIQTYQHFGTRLGSLFGCVCRPHCYENLFLAGPGVLVSRGFPLWVAVKLRGGNLKDWRGQGPSNTELSNILGPFRSPSCACFSSLFKPFSAHNIVCLRGVIWAPSLPPPSLPKCLSAH